MRRRPVGRGVRQQCRPAAQCSIVGAEAALGSLAGTRPPCGAVRCRTIFVRNTTKLDSRGGTTRRTREQRTREANSRQLYEAMQYSAMMSGPGLTRRSKPPAHPFGRCARGDRLARLDISSDGCSLKSYYSAQHVAAAPYGAYKHP